MHDEELLDSGIGFDALYESMYRCRKGVSWKDSVAHYCLNGIEEILRLEKQLKDGTYKPRPQKKVVITHPKPRIAVSIAFRDRIYQRSMNDNVIYPEMSKQFIHTNAACQKGKGTDFARDTLDKFLHEAYRKHGRDFYVLQGDIKGYYPNMPHRVAEENFKRYLPEPVYQRAERIMHEQYGGERGYNPGSQMIQIAGIAVLSPLDHFIKEKLRIKWYLRYMDDFILVHPDRGYLEYCKDAIKAYLAEFEFVPHPEKTRVYRGIGGIKTLGFTHRLTGTGKVIRIIDPDNVRAERKKLYRMAQRAKRGDMTVNKVRECYHSWKAHAEHGNSYQLIKRMDDYFNALWAERSMA